MIMGWNVKIILIYKRLNRSAEPHTHFCKFVVDRTYKLPTYVLSMLKIALLTCFFFGKSFDSNLRVVFENFAIMRVYIQLIYTYKY